MCKNPLVICIKVDGDIIIIKYVLLKLEKYVYIYINMVYKYKLSVCVCIKNEGKYMIDFIKHYIEQGVEHFYIIDNGSTDNIKEIIHQSMYKEMVSLIEDKRDMKILKDNSGMMGHVNLLNDNLYFLVKEESEWAIFVDADEFMYGKNGYTIKSFIDTLENDIGCVYVLWTIMNPYQDEEGNICEEFSIHKNVYRINYDKLNGIIGHIYHANDFGKSIVRTCMLKDNLKLWIHKIPTLGKIINNYENDSNEMVDNRNRIQYTEDKFKNLKIAMNHYAIRNREDYIKKEIQIETVSHKKNFILGLFEMIKIGNEYLVKDESLSLLHSN